MSPPMFDMYASNQKVILQILKLVKISKIYRYHHQILQISNQKMQILNAKMPETQFFHHSTKQPTTPNSPPCS